MWATDISSALVTGESVSLTLAVLTRVTERAVERRSQLAQDLGPIQDQLDQDEPTYVLFQAEVLL